MSQFVVQITPLLRPNDTITEADLLIPTQFSDVGVHHLLNSYRTAEVTLSQYDPVVEGLESREFALRILYEDRLEPVFWGPCDIADNYKLGKCVLSAQDSSFRMLHHYIRRGDEILNNIPERDKGLTNLDSNGFELVVAAAQNLVDQDTRNDPSLGVSVFNYDYPDTPDLPIIVERGQEVWQVLTNMVKHDLGPDMDSEVQFELDGGIYNYLGLYEDLGRDLTADITLNYGPQLPDVNINPGRATTHAHVLSRDAKFRRTGGSVAGSNKVGPTVDWVPTDLEFPDGNDDALQARANDIVKAYGIAPKFITIQTRPDAVLLDSYGSPYWTAPVGTKEATFYIGDRITIAAERGFRSFNGPARIIEVHLTQSGSRGPVTTGLKLVPTIGDLGDNEES